MLLLWVTLDGKISTRKSDIFEIKHKNKKYKYFDL
jgi:hypothetical protein